MWLAEPGSWTSVSGLARCSGEDAPLLPRGGIKTIGLRDRRDHEPLDLCSHLTVSMPARNCRGCIFRCSLKFVCSPCLDLVAQRCALAVGKCWIARRWRAALVSARFDRNIRKAGPFQLLTDQRHFMVAMGRPRQEARRIARKKLSERVSDVVRERVLFDTIPDVEQPVAARLENPSHLTVSASAAGKKHHSKLAADYIECRIVERQGH